MQYLVSVKKQITHLAYPEEYIWKVFRNSNKMENLLKTFNS